MRSRPKLAVRGGRHHSVLAGSRQAGGSSSSLCSHPGHGAFLRCLPLFCKAALSSRNLANLNYVKADAVSSDQLFQGKAPWKKKKKKKSCVFQLEKQKKTGKEPENRKHSKKEEHLWSHLTPHAQASPIHEAQGRALGSETHGLQGKTGRHEFYNLRR